MKVKMVWITPKMVKIRDKTPPPVGGPRWLKWTLRQGSPFWEWTTDASRASIFVDQEEANDTLDHLGISRDAVELEETSNDQP